MVKGVDILLLPRSCSF